MRFSFIQHVLGLLLVYTVSGQADVCQSIQAAISNASSVYYPGKLSTLVLPCCSYNNRGARIGELYARYLALVTTQHPVVDL